MSEDLEKRVEDLEGAVAELAEWLQRESGEDEGLEALHQRFKRRLAAEDGNAVLR